MAELTKELFLEEIGKLATDVSSLKTDVSTLKLDMKEVKQTVQRLDKRDKEDSDVFAKDITELQKKVKQLELKHA